MRNAVPHHRRCEKANKIKRNLMSSSYYTCWIHFSCSNSLLWLVFSGNELNAYMLIKLLGVIANVWIHFSWKIPWLSLTRCPYWIDYSCYNENHEGNPEYVSPFFQRWLRNQTEKKKTIFEHSSSFFSRKWRNSNCLHVVSLHQLNMERQHPSMHQYHL